VARPDDERPDPEVDEDGTGLPLDLGAYIREQREQARLSLRKLASRAGVSNPYLSQIERGLRNPSAEILQAIARGLEISSETLYVQAGILDPDHEERSDVETAIARSRELTESQRATLLEMYRSFRRLAALEIDSLAAAGAAAPGSSAAGPSAADAPVPGADRLAGEPAADDGDAADDGADEAGTVDDDQ